MEYLDISEVLGERMDPYLNQLLIRLNQAGDEIARTYFNTQVILPGPKSYQAVQAQQ
jgi:hypothetical protein